LIIDFRPVAFRGIIIFKPNIKYDSKAYLVIIRERYFFTQTQVYMVSNYCDSKICFQSSEKGKMATSAYFSLVL
jgi:hypothetical protein